MTPQQKRHVDAQKIVEGSPIGVRTPDIISGLSLAKLFKERDEFAAALQDLMSFVLEDYYPKLRQLTPEYRNAVERAKKALTVP